MLLGFPHLLHVSEPSPGPAPVVELEPVWRPVEELEPGDRVELGFTVCRVIAIDDDGVVVAVQERDGRARIVNRDATERYVSSLVRYVGGPGSDPLGRGIEDIIP